MRENPPGFSLFLLYLKCMKRLDSKHMPTLHFDDSDVTVDDLMRLLLDGDDRFPYARNKVFCQGMPLSDKGFVESLGEAVERCYKEKYPNSTKTPTLELYDPCGDDVYCIASLSTKSDDNVDWSVNLTKSNVQKNAEKRARLYDILGDVILYALLALCFIAIGIGIGLMMSL